MSDTPVSATAAPPSDPLRWVAALDPEMREALLQRLLVEMRNMAVPGPSILQLGSSVAFEGAWPSNNVRLGGNDRHVSPWLDIVFEHDIFPTHALETFRRDVASVARFSHRIEYAKVHLCAAFTTSDTDCEWTVSRSSARRKPAKTRTWTWTYAESTFRRYSELKDLLLCKWTPSHEAEPLAHAAFRSLSDLTPAHTQLLMLYEQDRPRAFDELAHLLDGVVDQLRRTTDLAETLAAEQAGAETAHDRARADAVHVDLLSRAGDILSVREAAKRLSMTRQNLHKRIKTGSALGLMHNKDVFVPTFQFVEGDGGGDLRIIERLRDILLPFAETGAGNWSALQFLIECDPNLECAPIEALRQGRLAETVAAGRAYLGLDDG